LKPDILILGSMFYQCCTPYMTANLHRCFPKLNIAAVSLSCYPDDLAMYFIINGARSYVSFWEGDKQFFKGLEIIRQGREYISPEVQRRIDERSEYPEPTGKLTGRQVGRNNQAGCEWVYREGNRKDAQYFRKDG